MSTSIVNSLVVVLLQHYLLLISDFLPYLVWDIYRNNAHWYTLPIGFYDCCWCLTITMHVLTSLFLLQNLLDDTIVEEYQVPGTTAFLLVLCHYDDGDGVEPTATDLRIKNEDEITPLLARNIMFPADIRR